MDKGTTYVALDDSKRKVVVAILRPGQTQPEQREMPKEPQLIRRLFQRLKREGPVEACYEAGVSGYDLHRQITACGVSCAVIAPALTPRRAGQRIKTDRRDAAKLVRLFRAGELTAIHVPDEAEEAVRDLLRCREAVRRDVLRWRHRLLKFLDRHGHLYVTGKNWSQRHWAWIRAQHFDLPALQRTFEATLFALEQTLAHQAELDKEIVTFQRFRRPRELMAYVGLVPSEYSSGETVRRGAITKTGNAHVRRALVEAAWHYRHRPTVGRVLAARSAGQPPEFLAHAWRAQQRLYRRYRHLVGHGKRPPVAVTAIARELVGFIWAAMTHRPAVAA